MDNESDDINEDRNRNKSTSILSIGWIGSDPETMEIVETLVRVGVIEKDSPWPMMRLVWGYEMRDEMISIEIETETDPPPFSALIE